MDEEHNREDYRRCQERIEWFEIQDRMRALERNDGFLWSGDEYCIDDDSEDEGRLEGNDGISDAVEKQAEEGEPGAVLSAAAQADLNDDDQSQLHSGESNDSGSVRPSQNPGIKLGTITNAQQPTNAPAADLKFPKGADLTAEEVIRAVVSVLRAMNDRPPHPKFSTTDTIGIDYTYAARFDDQCDLVLPIFLDIVQKDTPAPRAVLVVATATGDREIRITYFNSFEGERKRDLSAIEREAEMLVRTCGWQGEFLGGLEGWREFRKHVTIESAPCVSHSDDGLSGIHTILNAWAYLLGLKLDMKFCLPGPILKERMHMLVRNVVGGGVLISDVIGLLHAMSYIDITEDQALVDRWVGVETTRTIDTDFHEMLGGSIWAAFPTESEAFDTTLGVENPDLDLFDSKQGDDDGRVEVDHGTHSHGYVEKNEIENGNGEGDSEETVRASDQKNINDGRNSQDGGVLVKIDSGKGEQATNEEQKDEQDQLPGLESGEVVYHSTEDDHGKPQPAISRVQPANDTHNSWRNDEDLEKALMASLKDLLLSEAHQMEHARKLSLADVKKSPKGPGKADKKSFRFRLEKALEIDQGDQYREVAAALQSSKQDASFFDGHDKQSMSSDITASGQPSTNIPFWRAEFEQRMLRFPHPEIVKAFPSARTTQSKAMSAVEIMLAMASAYLSSPPQERFLLANSLKHDDDGGHQQPLERSSPLTKVKLVIPLFIYPWTEEHDLDPSTMFCVATWMLNGSIKVDIWSSLDERGLSLEPQDILDRLALTIWRCKTWTGGFFTVEQILKLLHPTWTWNSQPTHIASGLLAVLVAFAYRFDLKITEKIEHLNTEFKEDALELIGLAVSGRMDNCTIDAFLRANSLLVEVHNPFASPQNHLGKQILTMDVRKIEWQDYLRDEEFRLLSCHRDPFAQAEDGKSGKKGVKDAASPQRSDGFGATRDSDFEDPLGDHNYEGDDEVGQSGVDEPLEDEGTTAPLAIEPGNGKDISMIEPDDTTGKAYSRLTGQKTKVTKNTNNSGHQANTHTSARDSVSASDEDLFYDAESERPSRSPDKKTKSSTTASETRIIPSTRNTREAKSEKHPPQHDGARKSTAVDELVPSLAKDIEARNKWHLNTIKAACQASNDDATVVQASTCPPQIPHASQFVDVAIDDGGKSWRGQFSRRQKRKHGRRA